LNSPPIRSGAGAAPDAIEQPGAAASVPPTPHAEPRSAWFVAPAKTALQMVPLGILFVVWEIASRSNPDLALMLPPPTEVVSGAMQLIRDGSLPTDIWASLRRVFVALVFAAGIGLPLGLLIGLSKGAAWFFEPILNFFRPIPPLAWIPLSIVWLGISEAQNEFIIFLGAFFPILLNTVQGVRQIDPQLVRAASTLGATPFSIACTVIVPGALPSIFVGFRVGTGIAWMALVAGEIVAASSGLGYLIMQGRMLFRPDYIIVGMVVIGLIGLALDYGLRRLQKAIMRWEEL
jgi:ABC-type nitrate/sulfonate/bicarbonate transport system permease component